MLVYRSSTVEPQSYLTFEKYISVFVSRKYS